MFLNIETLFCKNCLRQYTSNQIGRRFISEQQSGYWVKILTKAAHTNITIFYVFLWLTTVIQTFVQNGDKSVLMELLKDCHPGGAGRYFI